MSGKRGNNEGTIYKRPDGRWAGMVDLGTVNGKRMRKSVSGRTRAAVADKLRALQGQKAAGTVVTQRMTVEQWLTHWLDVILAQRVIAGTMKPKTLDGYRSKARTILIPALGTVQLDALTPAQVRTAYAALRTQPGVRKGKPISESSIRTAHAIFKKALTDAMRDNLVSRDIMAMVDPPSTLTAKTIPLTVEQARQVIATAKGHEREARWHMALYQGMRQGEVLGLRWEHVNLDEAVAFIAETSQRITGLGIVTGTPKSDESVRAVPLLNTTVAQLRVLWAVQHRAGYDMSGYVFGRDGNTRAYDPRADWGQWKELLIAAGVPHVDLRAARATTGTLLMATGTVPDKIISEILGHASVIVTQRHYLRGNPELRAEAMRQLEAHVTGKPVPSSADAALAAREVETLTSVLDVALNATDPDELVGYLAARLAELRQQ